MIQPCRSGGCSWTSSASVRHRLSRTIFALHFHLTAVCWSRCLALELWRWRRPICASSWSRSCFGGSSGLRLRRFGRGCCLCSSRSDYRHDISECLESNVSARSGVDRVAQLTLMVGDWQALDSVLPVVSLGQVVHAFQAEIQTRGLYPVKRSRALGGRGGGERRTAGAQAIKYRIRSKWRTLNAVYKAKDRRHVRESTSVHCPEHTFGRRRARTQTRILPTRTFRSLPSTRT